MENLIRAIQNICQYLNVNTNEVQIYERSYNKVGKCHFIMFNMIHSKYLLVAGQGRLFDEINGESIFTCKICPLSHANRLILNKYLDYTVPKAFGPNVATFGVGDRLGITSPAHIKALANSGIRPVLAQQSKRELNLTGRSYDEILDSACFAVIQEGYREGFGADGDHLKDEKDIESAIKSGVSMITLDCSDRINYSVESIDADELNDLYEKLPVGVRTYYESTYLNQEFKIADIAYVFSKDILVRNVLIYDQVIEFIENIFETHILSCDRKIDFEISLDETLNATSLYGHLLVALEIEKRNIEISSMAPRFVGEFQKGVDYIGNIEDFEKNIVEHAHLADHFGYKLSIHSGSDKFSVFNAIGQATKGRFHIKTSGTSWLEAVKVISEVNPELYRKMHQYALLHFEEAKAYYHVSANLLAIENIETVSDRKLSEFLEKNDSRQLMHITYGLILNAKEDGKFIFRDEIFSTLGQFMKQYEEAIVKHISKHVDLLVDSTKMYLSFSLPFELKQLA